MTHPQHAIVYIKNKLNTTTIDLHSLLWLNGRQKDFELIWIQMVFFQNLLWDQNLAASKIKCQNYVFKMYMY